MRRVSALAALAALLACWPARGDLGSWSWIEYRLPLARYQPAEPAGLQLRLFTDVRLSDRAGLAQSFLRVGPLLDITPWLFLALHGVIYADRLPTGTFDQEVRVEVEPNFYGRLGPLTFNDRNRVEYRWRASGERFRYRNQLRVTYAPPGAKWLPHVWDEILIDLSGRGVNENRVSLGIGRMLNDYIRLDIGYLLRSRSLEGHWTHDHVLLLYLFVGVPPAPTAPK